MTPKSTINRQTLDSELSTISDTPIDNITNKKAFIDSRLWFIRWELKKDLTPDDRDFYRRYLQALLDFDTNYSWENPNIQQDIRKLLQEVQNNKTTSTIKQSDVITIRKELKEEVNEELEKGRMIEVMNQENIEKWLWFVALFSSLDWVEKQKIPELKNIELQQYETMIQGIVGGIFLESLYEHRYPIYFDSKTTVAVNTNEDPAIADTLKKSINTAIQKDPRIAQSLQLGMLYADGPLFAQYKDSVTDKDGKLKDPNTSLDDYVAFLNKKWNVNLTDLEKDFLRSRKHFGDINMPSVIRQFGQAQKIINNPQVSKGIKRAQWLSAGMDEAIGTVNKFIKGWVNVATTGMWGTINTLGDAMGAVGPAGSLLILLAIFWSMVTLWFWKTLTWMFLVGLYSNREKLPDAIKDAVSKAEKKVWSTASSVAATAAKTPVSAPQITPSSIPITDKWSLRRALLGLKPTDNIDAKSTVIEPFLFINALALQKALNKSDQTSWEQALNASGFDTMNEEQKQAILAILKNPQQKSQLATYISWLMWHDTIKELQKNQLPQKLQTMSIGDIEQYIITASKQGPTVSPSEQKEIKNIWTPVSTFEDGKMYIIGKDGKKKLFRYQDLSPEAKKAFEKLNSDHKKLDEYLLLIQALADKDESKMKSIYDLLESVIRGEKILKEFFAEVNPKIKELLWDDSKRVMQWLENLNDHNRINLYYYIKNDLKKYNIVSDRITGELVDVATMERMFTQLKEANFTEDSIRRLDLPSDRKEDMLEKYREISIVQGKMRDQFVEASKDTNGKIDKNKQRELEDQHMAQSMRIALQYNLAYDAVENGKQSWWQAEIFKDIEGIGFWNLKDSREDWYALIAEEVAIQLIAMAVGSLTAWVGYVWVNALRWVRVASKIKYVRWLRRMGMSLKWIKTMGTITSGTIGAIGTGTAFHVGYSGVVGGYEDGVSGAFDRIFDKSGWMTSVALMGAGRLLGQLHRVLWIAKTATGVTKTASRIHIDRMARLTIDGTVLGLTGGAINVYVEGGEWTHEALIQWFMMAIAQRAMGKMGNWIMNKPKSPANAPSSAGTSSQTGVTLSQQTGVSPSTRTLRWIPKGLRKQWTDSVSEWRGMQGKSVWEKIQWSAKILDNITNKQFFTDIVEHMLATRWKKGVIQIMTHIWKGAWKVPKHAMTGGNLKKTITKATIMSVADWMNGQDLTIGEITENFAISVLFGGWRSFIVEELADGSIWWSYYNIISNIVSSFFSQTDNT